MKSKILFFFLSLLICLSARAQNIDVQLQCSNQSICLGSCTQIIAHVQGANPPVIFIWTPTTGLSGNDTVKTACPASTTTYKLLVTDNLNYKDSATITITVNLLPVANAGPDKIICYGQSATIGSAPVAGNTYTWVAIPPGFTSTSSAPTVSPTSTTTYVVTQTVTLTGCSSQDAVVVTVNPQPTVTVNPANPTPFCSGGSILLTASGAISYSWTPALGLSSTTGSGVLAFPQNTTTYTVTGTAPNGCTGTAQVTVTVINPVASLVPWNGFINCSGGTFNFQAQDNSSPLTLTNFHIIWGDGNSNNYTSPPVPMTHNYPIGVYNLQYIVTDAAGCTDTANYTVFNITTPALSLGSLGNTVGCDSARFGFILGLFGSNHSTTIYKINWGDGSQIITYNHPPPDTVWHMYNHISCGLPNNYFTLSATAVNVCDSAIATIGSIKIFRSSIANFICPPIGCVGAPITFPNTSIPGTNANCTSNINYTWIFGDGSPNQNFINIANPANANGTHVYNTPGVYTVTLIAKNPGSTTCVDDSISYIICIRPAPIANFTLNNSSPSHCAPDTITLTNTSNTVIPDSCAPPTYSWGVSASSVCNPASGSWNYAPGYNQNSVNPVIIINSSGQYSFSLNINNGCVPAQGHTTSVTVIGPPQININPPSDICAGDSVCPTAAYQDCYGTNTYLWTFPNGTPASSTSMPPGCITYNTPGTYPVYLTATNQCGVAGDTSASFIVYPYPTVNVSNASYSICVGGLQTMSVTASGSTGTYNYQWQTSSINCTSGWVNIPGATSSTYTTPPLNIAGSYYYQCLVTPTGALCDPAVSGCITVNVNPDPVITLQPLDDTVCTGGSATMTVAATGGVGIFSYQWQSSVSGCSSGWTNIPGATNSSYTTPALTVTTYYQCIVSQTGSGCQAISNCATITVVGDPVIAPQPLGGTICTGGTFTMTIGITGGAGTVSYQWQASSAGCSTGWTNIPGATGATYTTPVLTATNYYQCIVTQTGSGCQSVSSCAVVNVISDPTISVQPANSSVCAGGTAIMNVTAAGGTGTFSYQWQNSTTACSSGWANIPGATGASYTTVPLFSTSYYQCVVIQSGNGCGTITSGCAVININPNPYFTIQPVGDTVCNGGSHTMTVTASGGVGTFSYQWQVSGMGCSSGWSDIPGATSASFTTPALSGTTYYQCIVSQSGSGCPAVTSNCAVVTILPYATITTQPIGDTVCNSGTYTMTVGASGGVGTFSYQWQNSIAGCSSGWANIPGASNSSYTTPTLALTTYYQCIVTQSGSGCGSLVSNCAAVTVISGATFTLQPTNGTICNGGNYTMTVAAAGGTGPVSYQWQSSVVGCGSGWTNIPGATNTSYTTSALVSTTWYQCVGTQAGSGCNFFVSNCATVTVIPDAVIVIQPNDNTICNGGITILNVTAAGGTGTFSYQWQVSPLGCSAGWSNIPGATNSSYTTPALTYTNYYQCIITQTGNGCNTLVSNCATINIVPGPVINPQPTDASICAGGTHSMTIGATGGIGTISYQWQSSNSGCSAGWVNIPGATGITYNTPPLFATTYFQCIAYQAGVGCQAISICATVTVVADPLINPQPLDGTVCNGGTNTMTVGVSGGIGIVSYQWQTSSTGCSSGWTNISGANGTSYTTPALAATAYYQCVVTQTGLGCESTSNCATVNVISDPYIAVQPAGATICDSGSATMSVTPAGGTGTFSYQWQMSPLGCTAGWTNIPGATNFSFTTPALLATTYFQCIVSQAGNGCNNITSSCAIVNVIANPVIVTQPAGDTVCVGGTHTMTVGANGGTGTFSYQWQSSNTGCGSGWFNIAGANNINYSTPALNSTTYYRCVIFQSGNGCNPVTTNCAVVVVIPDPVVTTQPAGGIICNGGTYTMNVMASGGTGQYLYQWQSSSSGCASGWTDIPGAINAAFTTTALTATTFYRCVISQTGSGCQAISNCATVNVIPDPVITAQPTGSNICAGGSTSLSITVTGGTGILTYQWQNSTIGCNSGWIDIPGATALTYATAVLSATTYFRCIVNQSGNGCDALTSACATVTVLTGPLVTLQPASGSVCAGGNYTMNVTTTGGVGTFSYQWQESNLGCGIGWTDIAGANASFYTTPPLSALTFYQCVISQSGNGCGTISSGCDTVSIAPNPFITLQPVDGMICSGGICTMSVAASGGVGTFSYQWQSSTAGCNSGWTNIPGATSDTLITSPLTSTTYYQCYITQSGSGCGSLTSACATVTVIPSPVITMQPAGATICTGGTSSLTTSASGGIGTFSYQWQSSATGCGSGWTDIAGATGASYTTPVLTATMNYQCIISQSGQGCADLITNCATITVVPDPVFSIQPMDDTICIGNSTTLSVTPTGGVGPYTYQWMASTNGCNGTWNNIPGAVNSLYTTPAMLNTGYYQCVVSQAASGCQSTSACATIDIYPVTVANFTYYDSVSPPPGHTNIIFVNTSQNATIYNWSFGDGSSSDEVNPVHSYVIGLTYDVMLIATNSYNCPDTLTISIPVDFPHGLYFPNAMSPTNPNPEVQQFIPVGKGLEAYHVQIYDTWGNLIWQSSALDKEGRPTESWDGTYKGEILPLDVFVWKANGVFKDGSLWEGMDYGKGKSTTGTITIIR